MGSALTFYRIIFISCVFVCVCVLQGEPFFLLYPSTYSTPCVRDDSSFYRQMQALCSQLQHRDSTSQRRKKARPSNAKRAGYERQTIHKPANQKHCRREKQRQSSVAFSREAMHLCMYGNCSVLLCRRCQFRAGLWFRSSFCNVKRGSVLSRACLWFFPSLLSPRTLTLSAAVLEQYYSNYTPYPNQKSVR